MIYLILAIASSAMVSIVMRASEKHIKNTMGMFMANYLVCVAMSRFFMGKISLFVNGEGIGFAVLVGVINGILYLGTFVLMKRCMTYNGAMLSSAFMKLGILVPTLMAILVFREQPEPAQILGIAVAVVAVVLINIEKGSVENSGRSRRGLLVILMLGSGFADSLANVYDKLGNPGFRDHYLFYTFFVAFLMALTLGLTGKGKICGKDLMFGFLLGIPNYFSARFLLLALGEVPAVVTYPVFSVGTIVAVSAVSMLVWKERLNKQKKYALGMVLVALVLLNV